ncbi:MAG TPA: TRAP transporter large permease [Deltaproteobacteria bacterium]|nr:MAG: C4-dicarboxylate ABC transporter permease [Desulfobacteraceae bacterium 4484_190.3]RLB17148.1 MAG: C4-dicarboxylate ABC transporter permease [Deltaproteobacteria bacterium]RLF61749.1 MAG: C4-dicarboxylate ABC transporter permease [Thermoplasmata archaeon]HDH98070.1 TRAP transporter large permease [Deltaproteobacteria bacterium]
MSLTTIGITGIVILIILLFSQMPVGFVMAFVGLFGFSYVVNFSAGLSLLARDIWGVFSSYGLTVIPLFVFMGQIAFHAGISKRLYDSAYVLLGSRRGGLAMATVGACAGFAAISGSTNATAATMATVTLPEMKRYKYDMGLATGTVAAAGSLGILIPPSVVFIVYGILTEQSIGKLFAAGILPGILLSFLFLMAIHLQVMRDPLLAPPGPKTDLKTKIKSFAGVLETLIIFGLVMGGIFFGFFTPTEAAAVGAFLTLTLSVIRRQLSWQGFVQSLADTIRISCMVMVIVTGATVFGHFLAVTRVPFELAGWVVSLPLPRSAIMMVIVLIYLFGGCFMDALAMIMLTIPIFFPVSQALGFDPIWFGVVIVLITEMGVITPPVGVNVYVVYGVAKDVPLEAIFKGVFPMVLALLVCNIILLFFPQIALFLPGLMR